MRRRIGFRAAKGSNGPAPIDPDQGLPGRRFSPSGEDVTSGGAVYGALVANERTKLGLTRTELAEMINTSPDTIARIEAGHPASVDILEQLAVALYPKLPPRWLRAPTLRTKAPAWRPNAPAPRPEAPESRPKAQDPRQKASIPRPKAPTGRPKAPAARATTETKPRERRPWPVDTLGFRWIWLSLAMPAAAILVLIAGGSIFSSNTSASLQPSAVAVSSVSGAPAAINKARVIARKEAAAEARRAAARRRAREAAAAAAAAAAASRAAAKAARQNTVTQSQPVAPVTPVAPVSSSPAPSGGGGGGSSGPAPSLQHGIGSGG